MLCKSVFQQMARPLSQKRVLMRQEIQIQKRLNTNNSPKSEFCATTILCVRKNGEVVMIGDGQVSRGSTIVKGNAKKVRKLTPGIVAGFAGGAADALTLFERLEQKLKKYPNQLLRAGVELGKDWRSDRYLRHLSAILLVADKDISLLVSGNGDVIELGIFLHFLFLF